jgi:hypothetical protein
MKPQIKGKNPKEYLVCEKISSNHTNEVEDTSIYFDWNTNMTAKHPSKLTLTINNNSKTQLKRYIRLLSKN